MISFCPKTILEDFCWKRAGGANMFCTLYVGPSENGVLAHFHPQKCFVKPGDRRTPPLSITDDYWHLYIKAYCHSNQTNNSRPFFCKNNQVYHGADDVPKHFLSCPVTFWDAQFWLHPLFTSLHARAAVVFRSRVCTCESDLDLAAEAHLGSHFGQGGGRAEANYNFF